MTIEPDQHEGGEAHRQPDPRSRRHQPRLASGQTGLLATETQTYGKMRREPYGSDRHFPGESSRRFLGVRPLGHVIPPLELPDGQHVEFLQAIPIFESERALTRFLVPRASMKLVGTQPPELRHHLVRSGMATRGKTLGPPSI